MGSLAGQLRGYEQVRSFYTANTLFTLIDFPMSLLFLVIIASIASPANQPGIKKAVHGTALRTKRPCEGACDHITTWWALTMACSISSCAAPLVLL